MTPCPPPFSSRNTNVFMQRKVEPAISLSLIDQAGVSRHTQQWHTSPGTDSQMRQVSICCPPHIFFILKHHPAHVVSGGGMQQQSDIIARWNRHRSDSGYQIKFSGAAGVAHQLNSTLLNISPSCGVVAINLGSAKNSPQNNAIAGDVAGLGDVCIRPAPYPAGSPRYAAPSEVPHEITCFNLPGIP